MEQQVNLYQPILGAEKRLFSARAIGVCLGVIILCLTAIGAFGTWRTGRVEREIAVLQKRQTAQLAMLERAGAVLVPGHDRAQLDSEAKELTAQIAARERALDLIRRGAVSAATGYAARLEALANRQIDGLWLKNIVVGSTEGGKLALRGDTLDRNLVPAYLAALAGEAALAGVRFDTLRMRRAHPEEAPAQLVFELGAPGLDFPATEEHR